MGKLIQVGFRLAVLGVDETQEKGPWHVLRPGSFNAPVLGARSTVGRSLCNRHVTTNGYAADFTPADGDMCPACNERL